MAETQGRLHRSKNVGDSKSSLWSILVCLSVAVMLILAMGACAEPTPTVDVAQYVDATLTSVAATSEAAVTPTFTLTSTPTLTPTPTNTSTPSPTPTLSISELIPPRGEYDHEGIEVTEEYDRFEEYTVVRIIQNGNPYIPADNLTVYYLYYGVTPSIPDVIGFEFWGESDDWQYLECYGVNFLIDDSIHIEPDTYRDGWVYTGFVLEQVGMYLTPEEFLHIANGEKVEVRICNDEFVLSQEQLEALRDMASRMQE